MVPPLSKTSIPTSLGESFTPFLAPHTFKIRWRRSNPTTPEGLEGGVGEEWNIGGHPVRKVTQSGL